MPLTEPVLEVQLSRHARADLAAWVERGLDRAFVSECECVDWLATQVDRLPAEVLDALWQLRAVDAPDVVVLRGLPVDEFPTPSTPSRHRSPDVFTAEPADLLHGLAAAVLGEPIGYLGQQDGRIFNDIVPVAELATRADHSGGSVHTFDLHTEDSFLPLAPTHFGLFCVRNDGGVPCTLGFLRGAEIGSEELGLLRRSRVRIRRNSGQSMSVGDDGRPRLPLIWGPEPVPYFRLNLAHFETQDFGSPEERAAARALQRVVLDSRRDVVLGVGDALWVDNRRVAHSRRPYHPRFDGTDRWLKRLTVVPDVDALAPLLVAPRVVDNDRLASHAAALPADWGPIR